MPDAVIFMIGGLAWKGRKALPATAKTRGVRLFGPGCGGACRIAVWAMTVALIELVVALGGLPCRHRCCTYQDLVPRCGMIC